MKTSKTLLFDVSIAVMVIPFSVIDFADATKDDRNPRDKTVERIQEKEDRQKILQELNMLNSEESDLKEQIKVEFNKQAREQIKERLKEVRSEIDSIKQDAHKKDMPKIQTQVLIKQQELFEEKLLDSEIVRFVTKVGIDIESKEIQIGLNQNIVNKTNEDAIIDQINSMMPKTANWHVVYSDATETLSCTQVECTPLVGGNLIKVVNAKPCSYGFQAKKGDTWGIITAGHCADGLVGNMAGDYSGYVMGTVIEERYYWGTSCDCAWITGNPSFVTNKVFGPGTTTYTVTETTQASEQQNDYVMKSGATGGIKFGVVSAINVSVINAEYGEYIKNLVRTDIEVEHGDSGGPVVDNYNRGNLYGIMSTHDWWGVYHVPIDRIIVHMKITPILN